MTFNLNNIFLIFGNIGGTEILVIVLLALLMFGGKKIPELMRGMGRGIREFNDAKNNVKTELEESIKEKEAKQEVAQKQSVAQ